MPGQSRRDARPTRPSHGGAADATVLGLVISPRTRSWYLGYERSEAEAPKTLAALLRWRHRGTFVAGWDDVARLATEHVTLRPGYTRYSPVLRDTE